MYDVLLHDVLQILYHYALGDAQVNVIVSLAFILHDKACNIRNIRGCTTLHVLPVPLCLRAMSAVVSPMGVR